MAARQYHGLLLDYMRKMGQTNAIHTLQGYRPLVAA
jgi:hypothetical protein